MSTMWENMATGIGAFLATYLIHSTLLCGCAWLLARSALGAGPRRRELLWKGALLGGIATSLLQTQLPLPQRVWDFSIAAVESPSDPVAMTQPQPMQPVFVTPDQAAVGFAEHGNSSNGAPAAVQSPARQSFGPSGWMLLVALWPAISAPLVLRLLYSAFRLEGCAPRAAIAPPSELLLLVRRISAEVGLRGGVRLVLSNRYGGPMVAGLLRGTLYLPPELLERLDRAQLEGLLAHELSHLARRDTRWNFYAGLVCSVFFFQPLNFWLRRQMRYEAELLADARSASALRDGLGLARCLAALAEWRPAPAANLAIGASAFRSTLGRRVQRLLSRAEEAPTGPGWGLLFTVLLLVVLFLSPRATPLANSPTKDSSMNSRSAVGPIAGGLMLLAGLTAPPLAAEEDRGVEVPQEEIALSELPAGLAGFFGEVRGTVVDAGERPIFKVTELKRVAERANRADKPAGIAGLIIRLAPQRNAELQRKFLARLEKDQEVTIYLRHAEQSVFFIAELTEEQRNWAEGGGGEKRESQSSNSSELPDGIAGFSGRVVGRLVSKNGEGDGLVLAIGRIERVWNGSRARNPESIVGRTLPISGVSGKFLAALAELRAGDGVQIEVKHIAGRGLVFLGEGLERAELAESERR